jgi:hypothetical protein
MISYKKAVPKPPAPTARAYTLLAGLDYASLPSRVNSRRSPDAMNVWKDYDSTLGQAIETRKGIYKLGRATGVTTNKIRGLHLFEGSTTKALIHCEKKIYLWDNFPADFTSENLTDLSVTMNDADSFSFMYDKKLYIIDQANYWVYDGSTITAVIGYIPTTFINIKPDGTNAEFYQYVNLIQDKRKNQFIADGTAVTFTLESNIDNDFVPTATINGVAAAHALAAVSYGSDIAGVITNATITLDELDKPTANAEVEITFKKTVTGYADMVKKCTLFSIYDNRVFLSGHPTYKDRLIHSEIYNPTYFSDDNYYDDGNDNIAVKAIVKADDQRLITIKENKGYNGKVYIHKAQTDYQLGRIYPTQDTSVDTGAICGINFKDSVHYLSPQGLKSINLNIPVFSYEKSTFINKMLSNESYLANAKMEVWKNYLCILVDGKMYLADGQQVNDIYQYEWYLWDNIGLYSVGASAATFEKASFIKSYNDDLFIATDSGHICKFAEDYDNFIGGEDTDYFKALTALAADTETTITTFLKQPQFPCEITLTGNSATATGTATINALDYKGNAISFEMNLAGTDTVRSEKEVASIVSVILPTRAADSAETDAVSIGIGNKIAIKAYWTTPIDMFGTITHLKTVSKKGGVAQIKRIPNSIIKIDIKTDRSSDWEHIDTFPTSGFDFANLDFANFSFGTGERGLIVYNIKRRKVKEFSMKFYSDELRKPFGLYEAALELYIGNYIKS